MSSLSARVHNFFVEDYETSSFNQWRRENIAFCCSYSGKIVTSPVRAGRYAARFELHHGDRKIWFGKRAELSRSGDNRFGKIGGTDEWYGFSIYLPDDYEDDSEYEILTQWHAKRDEGEVFRSPVLSLHTYNGNWWIRNIHSSKPIQTDNDGVRKVLWEASYEDDKGKWTDWVVHVKWSYLSDGFVEIWKNSQKLTLKTGKKRYNGPDCYNDKRNIYLQSGIYKSPWNENPPTEVIKRVIYYDELRIGDSNSSFAEVSPPSPRPQSPSRYHNK